MAPSTQRSASSLAVTLSAPALGLFACRAFVPVGAPRSLTSAPLIEGAQPVPNSRAESSSSALSASALGLGLTALAASATARKTTRKATAVEEAPAVVEEAVEAPAAEEVAPPPFDPAKQIGATEPLGFFDPLGVSKLMDEQSWRQYRAAELKHGRVAMMAAVGTVGQHFIKFPGFDQVPSGLGAVITAPGSIGLGLLVVLSGVLELLVWQQDPKKEPGNFGDPAGLLAVGKYDDEWRNRELNNGRMAMFAITGILIAEMVSGRDGVAQILG